MTNQAKLRLRFVVTGPAIRAFKRLVQQLMRLLLVAGILLVWGCLAQKPAPPNPPAASPTLTIPAGTRVMLGLRVPVWAKSAQPGETVYTETTFPVPYLTEALATLADSWRVHDRGGSCTYEMESADPAVPAAGAPPVDRESPRAAAINRAGRIHRVHDRRRRFPYSGGEN